MWWKIRYRSPRRISSHVIQLAPVCSKSDSLPISRHRLSSTARTTSSSTTSNACSVRRHGRRLHSARDARPMPIELVVADQRRRVLVAEIDRLRTVAIPKIGQPDEIQARPELVVVPNQIGQGLATSSSDCELIGARLFSGERLDRRRQPVQRGGVAAHDPLTLLGREPPDRPVRASRSSSAGSRWRTSGSRRDPSSPGIPGTCRR